MITQEGIILIEAARRKQLAPKVDFEGLQLAARSQDARLLELSDALDRLATDEPTAAQIVEARVFAGLSVEEAASVLGLSRATAYREWSFARAWLATALGENLINPGGLYSKGPMTILSKPVEPEDLLAAIDSMIEADSKAG